MKNNIPILGILFLTFYFSTSVFGQAPTFTSTPITAIDAGNTYTYTITTSDPNGDNVTVTAPTIPGWLSLVTDAGGDVTTLAGSGSVGSTDANGASASFYRPFGVAVDASGNVYVADGSNHKIRKIAPNGDVTTLAGSGSQGSTDANGASASFTLPAGVAVDASGNVYVADQLLKSIADSIELIKSSQDKMKRDCSEEIPYGFTTNRFGELRVHPGATIIREADNNIRACLKQLGIKIEIKKVKEISLMDQIMPRRIL